MIHEATSPSAQHYAVAAFANQYNVIACGGALLFSLAFASPWPALVGAAAEGVWLLVAPRLGAFQRWVATRDRRRQVASLDDEVLATLADLDAAYASRFASLARAVGEIEELYANQSGVARSDVEAAHARLDELRRAFLEFSRIHQRLSRFVADTPAAELEREVQTLTRALTGEKDLGVRFTVRQALTLAQRRLQQLDQIANTRRAVEVRMETIEKSFAYLKSRVLGFGGGRDLYTEIEALTAQVGSVADIEAATQAVMNNATAQTGT